MSKPVERVTGSCEICSSVAKDYNFGVLSCEGCKGFFRRAMGGVPTEVIDRILSQVYGQKCL